ncbi:MAG: head GIN domain-containing protein [Flavobacteriaceae bacterium]
MKKIIILLTVLISVNLTAQSWFGEKVKGNGHIVNEFRNVGDYDEIAVVGAFEVNLVSGKEGDLKIKIEDNLSQYLITEVSKGKLKIRWKKNINIKSHKAIFITVPFKDLTGVYLVGSAEITSTSVIKAENFMLKLTGSGDLQLEVEANNVTTKLAGSGDITLNGKTDFLKVSVAGSGGFHGFNFKADEVEAKLAGSGDIDVYASEKLTGSIAGSGDIEYDGNPEIENTKIVGSGDISKH